MKFMSWLEHLLPATKHDIRKILMKESELAQALTDLQGQLARVNGEIQGKITALQDQITNADVPQSVTDALAALKTSAQALDDIVPDAPPATPAPAAP